MPDELKPLVQRMIDAGESEENIATVIKHFGQQPPQLSAVSNEEPGTFAGGFVQSLKDQGREVLAGLKPMLESAAHPQTAGDFSQLLMPSGAIGVGATGAAKGAEMLGDAAHATRAPIGGAISAVGRGVEAAGKATTLPGRYIGLGTLYNHPIVGAAEIAGPPLMKATGRLMQRTGKMIAPAAEVAAETAPQVAQAATEAAPAGLSAADRALLIKKYPGLDPAKVEQQMSGQLRMVPSHESPLQQPRVDVGAEQVGRGQGLTKEQVRSQTAPILGEAPGEASPIFPQQTLGKIVDAVKALPSSEREAYVAKATSGKAQWQIENIRRTLEHLGLLVGATTGAGAIREQVKQRLAQ